MTNKNSRFKFTKKEISLSSSRKGRGQEMNSFTTERNYSEQLLKILNSNKSYNNSIYNHKKERNNNIKQISFNKKELIIKNKAKKSKFENIKTINHRKKLLKID